MKVEEISSFETLAVGVVLGQRFGDGSVYVRCHHDRLMVKKAKRLGLVDEEGFITRAGRMFRQHLELSNVA